MKEHLKIPTYYQAKCMEKCSGIILSEEQIISYVEQREKMPTDNEPDSEPWCLSDQELFNSILEEDQSAIFKGRYPNIFF